MPYQPTGRPVGRPKEKDYETFSLKIPTDFLNQVKACAQAKGVTVAVLIREGLKWRITATDDEVTAVRGRGEEREYFGNTEGNTALLNQILESVRRVSAVVEPLANALPVAEKIRLDAQRPRGETPRDQGKLPLESAAAESSEAVQAVETPPPTRRRAHEGGREMKEKAIALRQEFQYFRLSLREFSRAAFEKGIYATSKDGTQRPFNPGTLDKWFKAAGIE
jgi:hypothetical protein